MKPCFGKRKRIAWLALGELDARQAQDLRAHVETCEGCRGYFEEMSAVARRLAAAEDPPEIEASTSFHRSLVGRLRAEPSETGWERAANWLSAFGLTWRVALPVAGAAALVVALLSLFPRQPSGLRSAQLTRPVVAPPAATDDLSPTVANYQRAATRSLDALDELLARQARRNPSPTPIYTASIVALVNVSD